MEFTKLSEVDIVETANDTDKVLIEQNGEIKRVPKTEVGGGGGAGLVFIFDAATETVTANMTLTEARDAFNKRELDGATFFMDSPQGALVTKMTMLADMSALMGAETMVIAIVYPEDMQFFWTADGISTEPPEGLG